jgi:hypothetical protein
MGITQPTLFHDVLLKLQRPPVALLWQLAHRPSPDAQVDMQQKQSRMPYPDRRRTRHAARLFRIVASRARAR